MLHVFRNLIPQQFIKVFFSRARTTEEERKKSKRFADWKKCSFNIKGSVNLWGTSMLTYGLNFII